MAGAVGSMQLVAGVWQVGSPAAEATVATVTDGVLIYKVGDPSASSIGDGLVDACVTTCAANLGVSIDGSGVLTLSGGNTYTGRTSLNGGTLSVSTIADTVSSGIGIGTTGGLAFNGWALQFTGPPSL